MAKAQRGAAETRTRVSAHAGRGRRSFEGKWAREGKGRGWPPQGKDEGEDRLG